MADLRENLIEFLIENYHIDSDDFTKDTSLVTSGIIDSMGIIELVSFIEETYDIVIDDEQITTENFENIRNIVKFISKGNDN